MLFASARLMNPSSAVYARHASIVARSYLTPSIVSYADFAFGLDLASAEVNSFSV